MFQLPDSFGAGAWQLCAVVFKIIVDAHAVSLPWRGAVVAALQLCPTATQRASWKPSRQEDAGGQATIQTPVLPRSRDRQAVQVL